MFIQILLFGSGLAFGVKNRKYRQKLQSTNRLKQNRALKPKPTQTPSSLYKKGKTGLRALKKVMKTSMSGGELRQQHIQQMTTVSGDRAREAAQNHQLYASEKKTG